ncbi:MAG: dienelactone hydrolase family protein [Acetobacteraceae bacterium]
MPELNVLRSGPASGGAARQLVVLCHGVGADAHDLIDLAASWAHAVPDAAFVAVDAPEPYDAAPMGRQWFSLADRTPAVLDAGARRAAPPLMATIAAELGRLGLPADAVALMGFSQGAMMVLHAGLRRTPPPRAILAYSGALLDSLQLDQEITGRPPVLLVHGRDDEVVPFLRGPAALARLQGLGVPVQPEWRPGLGHGIDEVGLMEGALFLQRAFATV